MSTRKIRKTGLLFGEGKTEYSFFNFLLKTEKFRYLESDWSLDADHASGASCDDVLRACIQRATNERSYDVILCFIDTDKLYHDFPNDHHKQKTELEAKATLYNIEILWQEEKHEDMIEVASKGKIKGKAGMKKKLERHRELILRSDFVKFIFKHFHNHK